MIVEHVFVTAMAEPEARERAAELLRRMGFAIAGPAAGGPMNGPPVNSVSANVVLANSAWVDGAGGRKRGRYSKIVGEMPRRVRLAFDRGRVTLAVGVMAKPRGQRARDEAEAMLVIIAGGVAKVLIGEQPLEDAAGAWKRLEEEWARRARRRLVVRCVAAVVVVGLVAGVVVLAVKS